VFEQVATMIDVHGRHACVY